MYDLHENGGESVAELCKEHDEMLFILLWLTNPSTKATNSSYCVPSVRVFARYWYWLQTSCPGNPHTMCVHVNISQKLGDWWKSFSPTVSIYKDNSGSPDVSNAVNLHTAH